MRIPIEAIFLREAEAPTLQGRLAAAVVRAILESRARPGTLLPSSRKLAQALGMSRMTVTLVYQELVSLGYLETRPRSGIAVAATVPHRRLRLEEFKGQRTDAETAGSPPDWQSWLSDQSSPRRVIRKPPDWQSYLYPFIYGQPDPVLFDHNAWRDCARRATPCERAPRRRSCSSVRCFPLHRTVTHISQMRKTPRRRVVGRGDGTRTRDLLLPKQARLPLRYAPN